MYQEKYTDGSPFSSLNAIFISLVLQEYTSQFFSESRHILTSVQVSIFILGQLKILINF